jgi:transcriptional regulator with XRE-family HTH domain
MDGQKLVARNVKLLRVKRGLSQERLASDAQVDRSYLGSLERGKENPTVAVLDRVAKVLDVPLSDLFARTNEGVPAGLKAGRKPIRKPAASRKKSGS